jgi:hypothetical protein
MLLDFAVQWRPRRYILPGTIFPAVWSRCRRRVEVSGVRVAFAERTAGGEGRLLAIWKLSVKGVGVNLMRYQVARVFLSQFTSVATSLSSSSPFLSSSTVRSIACCRCANNFLGKESMVVREGGYAT